jgi:hypothetical protein
MNGDRGNKCEKLTLEIAGQRAALCLAYSQSQEAHLFFRQKKNQVIFNSPLHKFYQNQNPQRAKRRERPRPLLTLVVCASM